MTGFLRKSITVLLGLAAGGLAGEDFGAAAGGPGTCKTCSMSCYALPKKLLLVKVSEDPESAAEGDEIKVAAHLRAAADRSLTFCLDFLESHAPDGPPIKVVRTSQGLLQSISTITADGSNDIAQAVVGAAAAMVTARKLRSEAPMRTRQFRAEADPFDLSSMTELNRTLNGLGYCVFLDGSNDPFVPTWSTAETLCAGSAQGSRVSGTTAPADPETREKPASTAERPGLLYRPELAHVLHILKRDKPASGAGTWLLIKTQTVFLPNGAPLLRLRAERSLFFDRGAEIDFEDGTPSTITVGTAGDLAGFVSIPLVLTDEIVPLPPAAIQVTIGEASGRAGLRRAEAGLIEAQRLFLQQRMRDGDR